jgi:head-tail adaptor
MIYCTEDVKSEIVDGALWFQVNSDSEFELESTSVGVSNQRRLWLRFAAEVRASLSLKSLSTDVAMRLCFPPGLLCLAFPLDISCLWTNRKSSAA